VRRVQEQFVSFDLF